MVKGWDSGYLWGFPSQQIWCFLACDIMVNEREAENVAVEFKTLQKVAPGDLWVFHPKVAERTQIKNLLFLKQRKLGDR